MEANRKLNIAIFASGRGSNAQNIFEFVKEQGQSFGIKISCLITDKEDAGVIDFGKLYDIPTFVIPKKTSKENHEKEILKILEEKSIDYICLCGYMRILSEKFVQRFENKIINVHPSLLPDFPGKDGYGDAYKANVQESGITIHFVDEGIDTGKIILQKRFKRELTDSLDEFRNRGMQLEYQAYREVLEKLALNGEL